MSAVEEALHAYRAAVDESRRAEYAKQKAAQALYEARQAEGHEDEHVGAAVAAEEPMPDTAFEHAIAYVEEPTKDGRKIAPGGIDWQFGKRIPVTSGFEGGQVIGHAITSHIDDSGAVMATLYIEERVRRLITPLDTAISLGVGLDNIEAEVSNEEPPFMTIKSGRLRHVAAQPAESAAWPGVVVNR